MLVTEDGHTANDRSADEMPAEQLQLLLEVSRTLGMTLDLPTVMQRAIEAACRVMKHETGAIYLLTDGNVFLGATTPALPANYPDSLRYACLGDHPHLQRSIEERSPLTLEDAPTAVLSDAERAIVDARGLRSVLYVPLIAGDSAVGAFILGDCVAPRNFPPSEIALASALASIIALAVANARLYEAQRGSLTELAHAYEEAEAVKQQLRALAVKLTAAEDKQRHHIAVEIHDRIAQPLAMLKMKLGGSVEAYAAHEQDDTYRLVLKLLDEALVQTREVMAEASPPYLFDLGLRPALEWLGQRTTDLGVPCEVFCDPEIEDAEEDAKLFLFQAARELLANVAKHSGARYASLTAWCEDHSMCIKVTDDGRGFPTNTMDRRPASDHGFGLFSLSERVRYANGSLDVASALGVGTTVTLCVPAGHRMPH